MAKINNLDVEVHVTNDRDPDSLSSSFDSADSIYKYNPNKIPIYSSMAGIINIEKRTVVDFELRVEIFNPKSWERVKEVGEIEIIRDIQKIQNIKKLKREKEMEINKKRNGCGPKCVIF